MSAPGDLPPGHALLVVRAWTGEPGHPGLSARVWSTPDVGTTDPTVRVVRSVDDLLAAVRDWVAPLDANRSEAAGTRDAGAQDGPPPGSDGRDLPGPPGPA